MANRWWKLRNAEGCVNSVAAELAGVREILSKLTLSGCTQRLAWSLCCSVDEFLVRAKRALRL